MTRLGYAHQARTVMVYAVLSTDHNTPAPSKTLTVTISKAGAAFASISPTVTDRGNGWYSIALTAVHFDTVGDLALRATHADIDDIAVLFDVQPLFVRPMVAVTTGTSATVFAATGLSYANDDDLNDAWIVFLSGTAANIGVPRKVLDYAGGTKQITLEDGLPATPAATDQFAVIVN